MSNGGPGTPAPPLGVGPGLQQPKGVFHEALLELPMSQRVILILVVFSFS